jgi:hypothetical protein
MQATDIELAGAGYMVLPGSYRRAQDGLPEGRTGRIVARDFFGGQHRAYQLERDRGWDAAGTGPAYGGQGIEPWPSSVAFIDGVLPPASDQPRPSLVAAGFLFTAAGSTLYRSVAATDPMWGNVTALVTLLAGPITGLAYYRGQIACLLGSNGDIRLVDPVTGVVTLLLAGERGRHGVGYGRHVVYGDANAGQDDVLAIASGAGVDRRDLDAPIMNISAYGGKVAVATRQSIWLLGGKSDPTTGKWTADPEPFFTGGFWSASDDFAFLLAHGGRLYTWLANQVMEFRPTGGDRETRGIWRATGIEGETCLGATVAGGWLVVSLLTRNQESEVWGWDGSGWWLIFRGPDAGVGARRCWPAHTGGAGDRDLVVFRDGTATYDLYRMVWRSPDLHSYSTSGSYRTSLLDAGERDKLKAWRKVGCAFAAPEPRGNPATTDTSVTVALAYSLDGGATFTTAATANLTDRATRTVDLEANLPSDAATSRFVQLRVTWSGVTDWAPVLAGIWAEYELLDTPARRQRWAFSVRARDATVRRDGGIHARSGRQLATDLWAAWRGGTTITFRDVDFDTTAITHNVRLSGISEEIPKPADAAQWGDSLLHLVLVEI